MSTGHEKLVHAYGAIEFEQRIHRFPGRMQNMPLSRASCAAQVALATVLSEFIGSNGIGCSSSARPRLADPPQSKMRTA